MIRNPAFVPCKRTPRSRGVGLIVALAGLIGISTAAIAQTNWTDVITAAKKEGKVVIYNGSVFPIIRRLGDSFQKEYGISVDVLDARASEIRERIRSEQAAGRPIGDLIYSGSTSIALQTAEGAFQKHAPLPLLGTLAPEFTPDGTFVPASAGNFAVLLNSNLVPEKDAPKSWRDLTDPKWHGKVLSDDPRALGGAQVWFEVTYRAFGRDFHEKMAAHKPVFSRDWAQSNQRIARGEFPVYIPFNISEFHSLKGLPVRPLIPEEGIPYVQFGTAILKDAPHPHAALLFMNWLLDQNQQLMFVNNGFRPAAKGLASQIPPELLPLTQAKALGTTEPGKTQQFLDLAKEIYR